MPNDFSGDSNCKAVWNMESGALTTDSKGTNTLTNSGFSEDTVNYKQGACSGKSVRSESDMMYRSNANLNSGFPLKSGETNYTFSFTFWFKCTVGVINYQNILSLSNANQFSVRVFVCANVVAFYISSNGTVWTHSFWHDSVIVINRWYHVGITYNNSDAGGRIRIWDDTAQAILGVDKTGTLFQPNIGTSDFEIGMNSTDQALDGNLDEVVAFNDVLSVAEIDAIRAGTYGAPAAVVNKIVRDKPKGSYTNFRCVSKSLIIN